MKSFRHHLLVAVLTGLAMLLTGLFLLVIQFFPLYEEAEDKFRVLLLLALVFIGAFIVSAVIGHRVIKVHLMPIENATDTAKELVRGNYSARAYESGTAGISQLSTTVNVLARNLQEISAVREMEQERLKTLIENMGSGLIMIDRQGSVSLVNKAFLREFDIESDSVNGKFFKEIGLPETLKQFIEQVFMTETSAREQLEFERNLALKHLDVYGAPVIGKHERWLGIVIVLHDITELKRLEQIRKDFVANVSHELKTPVTSIKGFTETLLDGAYKDASTSLSFLEIIQKESNRLEMLIKDLLDLSRVESSDFQVNAQPVDMKKVIRQAADLTRRQMEEKAICLEMELQTVIVQGDPDRLIQVLMNLLVNAITYSSSETTIEVRLYERNGEAVIRVEDEGIGIEASEVGRLFERFYRVDRARSRNSGGTGLGLSIVKHLLEAHGGRVEVDSTVGVGTTFTVYLPLAT